MSRSRSTHHVPRGSIDPIDSRTDALAVLALAAPFGHDTVAILLDPERRGVGILIVTGTTHPDAMFEVIDVCIQAQRTEVDLIAQRGSILAADGSDLSTDQLAVDVTASPRVIVDPKAVAAKIGKM